MLARLSFEASPPKSVGRHLFGVSPQAIPQLAQIRQLCLLDTKTSHSKMWRTKEENESYKTHGISSTAFHKGLFINDVIIFGG